MIVVVAAPSPLVLVDVLTPLMYAAVLLSVSSASLSKVLAQFSAPEAYPSHRLDRPTFLYLYLAHVAVVQAGLPVFEVDPKLAAVDFSVALAVAVVIVVVVIVVEVAVVVVSVPEEDVDPVQKIALAIEVVDGKKAVSVVEPVTVVVVLATVVLVMS